MEGGLLVNQSYHALCWLFAMTTRAGVRGSSCQTKKQPARSLPPERVEKVREVGTKGIPDMF